MYECPNCAANLKFDIKTQQLHCDHCGTYMDPYSFHKVQDAEETTEYEVTIFTCPQCGGEIISDETTAATFCSYCDSSTILDSRISKERLPKYIIPFSKTIDDCKASYKKMMRHAPFAPKELKDPKYIQKFRGIYMPYWVYSFEKKGPVTLKGTKTNRKGDYVYTWHYDLTCDIDSEYDGIAYDASSTFADSLSSAIAPFQTQNKKPFVPSFLSGFYADTNDVMDVVYQQEAEQMTINNSYEQIKKNRLFSGYNINSYGDILLPNCKNADLAMFPVWFLSYRNKDRVAYAVINGQTGTAAADLPVDMKKYLFGSLLLALPLFILLNLLFTLKPTTILTISILLAMLCTSIANKQISRALYKESNIDDRGLQSKNAANNTNDSTRKQKKTIRQIIHENPIIFILILLVGIPMLCVFALPLMYIFIMIMLFIEIDFTVLAVFGSAILVFAAYKFISMIASLSSPQSAAKKKNPFLYRQWKKKMPTLLKPILAIVIAFIIFIINPVADMPYYIAAIVCIGMSCIAFWDIIKYHNILTTRKLPQLNRRGGDENA